MFLVLLDMGNLTRYNVLNRIAGRVSALHPLWQNLWLSDSRQLCQGWDGYYLFFKLRIATINSATVRIIINSSYVLISIILSVASERMKSTSSSCPVKDTITMITKIEDMDGGQCCVILF